MLAPAPALPLGRLARPPSRLGLLMGLYAENHRKLERLFAPSRLPPGHYVSHPPRALPLHLDVLYQHRYTTELRLSYAMRDALTGLPDPSAHLRQYHDACQSEASHCYVGQRWQDVLGLYPPPAKVMGHRLQMNTFLGKWLDYLAGQGHHRDGLVQADDAPE